MVRRRREPPRPVEWDGGEWVDVGPDGRWRPSVGERFRALTVLGVFFGILLVLGVLLSIGGDDDEDDVTASTTTTDGSPTTASTTTEPIDPTSVAGEDPPEPCIFDDRQSMALRPPADVVVKVLNGTPKGGFAGDVTRRLAGLGYESVEPGNAGRIAVTRIDYRVGYCAEAFRMITDLGVPTTALYAMEPGSDAALSRSDLLITLGRDSLEDAAG